MSSEARYTVEISEKAIGFLEKIPKKKAGQILAKIERLEFGLSGDIKKLYTREPIYRLRAGKYRVLFEIQKRLITILDVGDRKNIYR